VRKRSSLSNAANVKVIANSAETLDGLHAYLAQFGLPSSGTRYLSETKNLPSEVAATVLFPDDFEPGDVVEAVELLQRARPEVLVVLVTGAPQRLGELNYKNSACASPVVLAKPALGWTLVDLLRAHINA
jgi:hypothetical protein